jgi:DNA-binding transcriptional LysR family regulator
VRALETELGFDLFARLPRGVEPTPAGEALAEDVRQVLALLEQAVRKASRIARGELGEVTLGMTSSAAFHPLPLSLVRQFRSAYADVAIELVELNAAELLERMVRGTIQVAILRRPVETPAQLGFAPLVDEEMVLVLPQHHPLAQASLRSGLALRQLRDASFILVRRPGAPGLYAEFIAACRQAGFEPRIAQEVPRMAVGIDLVAAGLGVTVVPASMQRYGQYAVVYRKLARGSRLGAPLHLVYRRDEPNAAARRFTELARGSASAGP